MSFQMEDVVIDDVVKEHPFIVITKLRRNHKYKALLNWKEITEEDYFLFNDILYNINEYTLTDYKAHFHRLGLDPGDFRKRIPKDFVGELPVRVFNCLENLGIETLEDLFEASKEDLFRARNFGNKSYEELNDWLYKKYHWVIRSKSIK